MASQIQARRRFRYRSLHIDKSQPLGHGSYGAVYKAKCDQLPCAAKILHQAILNPGDPGADKIEQRFRQECEFLECIRHPNIVQYLDMTRDPESKLSVLLMELLDESLTKMLERSQQSLAYHVQVDICHDIALAVAYLHSNDIIHRDLSSNNVLMIAGRRAKVTDFGMSKLAGAAPSATPLTMCPGTLAYMPPEALEEPPTYTKKLDCFSEGVIMIQVCTRLWPDPGPRTKMVQDPRSPTGKTQMPVLEPERRKDHIDMVAGCCPTFIPIIKDCLRYKEEDRPSSEKLCQLLGDFKESTIYTESVQHVARMQNGTIEIDRPIQGTNVQRADNQRLPRTRKVTLGEWRDEGKAPIEMARGAVAVDHDVAYFMGQAGHVCSYNCNSESWNELPKCPYKHSCLVIINGLLTVIGGTRIIGAENKLHSFMNDTEWIEHFPPMPTKRYGAAAITTEQHLIVAGGNSRIFNYLTKVDVMDNQTLVWSTAASLPHPYSWASATICGDRLYMLGGYDGSNMTKSVLTCSLTKLTQSTDKTSDSVWFRVTDVPVYRSTCATANKELVIVGGLNETADESTAAVYKYNSTTNSWDSISNMPTARHGCLVAVLPKSDMIVGGFMDHHCSDKIEISNLNLA